MEPTMWIRETYRAIEEVSGRMGEEFITPARNKYVMGEEKVSGQVRRVDLALEENIPRAYKPVKNFMGRTWENIVEVTNPLQVKTEELLDNESVRKVLDHIATCLRWCAFFIFFLVGLVMNQVNINTLRRHIYSWWARFLLLPAFAVGAVIRGFFRLRTGLVDKQLQGMSSIVAKPFSLAHGILENRVPKALPLVDLVRDITVVMALGVPAFYMVIATNAYQILRRDDSTQAGAPTQPSDKEAAEHGAEEHGAERAAGDQTDEHEA